MTPEQKKTLLEMSLLMRKAREDRSKQIDAEAVKAMSKMSKEGLLIREIEPLAESTPESRAAAMKLFSGRMRTDPQ